MKDIFGGSGSIEAIFGISSGSTVTFSNLGGAADESLKLGFLVEQYQIRWSRSVMTKRMFNMNGRLAIVGAGNGSMTLSGLVGAADEFEQLIQKTSSQDVCASPVCTILANNGFGVCQNGESIKSNDAVEIVCKGILLADITLGGQISDNSTLLTQGTLTFNISGVDINRKSGVGGGSTTYTLGGNTTTTTTPFVSALG